MSAKRQRVGEEGKIAIHVIVEFAKCDPRMAHTTYQSKFYFPGDSTVRIIDFARIFPDRAFVWYGNEEVELITDIDSIVCAGDALHVVSWPEDAPEKRLKFLHDIAVHDEKAMILEESFEIVRRAANAERKKVAAKARERLEAELAALK